MSYNGSDSGQRTEQERERARAERERRRLAKAGSAAPVPLEPPIPPPAPAPVPAPAPAPVPAEAPASPAPLPRDTPRKGLRRSRPHAPHLRKTKARSRPSRPTRKHGTAARLAAVIAFVVALAAIASAAVLLLKPGTHTPAPPPLPTVVKVVIPEGFTRAQIAERVHAEGLRGNYLAASAHSSELTPAHYGAPAHTHDLEGFLFPATYELYSGESVARLVSEQLTAFKENFGGDEARRAHALGVTPYQLLIVASMVEREAQVPADRAKIAAVIYNRLHDGMPLGIDATIYYAVEQQRHIATYTGELTESQLHIASPYNTRLHTGLTPTPISNPGLASIDAAAHPAHVPYLYYVAGADGCGEQVFSATLAEFEIDAAAYHAAVAHNGGKPPSCKRK